jgi:hypothetical protein
MQIFSADQLKAVPTTDIPDPFTPCNHREILNWKDRKSILQSGIDES